MRSFTDWRTPARSAGHGNCVEVGSAPGLVGVRDTKDRDGAVLRFSRAQWSVFVAGLKRAR